MSAAVITEFEKLIHGEDLDLQILCLQFLARKIHKKGSFLIQVIVLLYGYGHKPFNNELGGNYRE